MTNACLIESFLPSRRTGTSLYAMGSLVGAVSRQTLIICAPKKAAPRDERYLEDQEQIAAQRAHLERLASVERYPVLFANAARLAVNVLRSQLLDILASAEGVHGTGAGLVDFAQERMRHGEIIGRELAIETVRGWFDGASRGGP